MIGGAISSNILDKKKKKKDCSDEWLFLKCI